MARNRLWRSIAAQLGDAPAQRRDGDRANELNGHLLALDLRRGLQQGRSLLAELHDNEPPPADDDTPTLWNATPITLLDDDEPTDPHITLQPDHR